MKRGVRSVGDWSVGERDLARCFCLRCLVWEARRLERVERVEWDERRVEASRDRWSVAFATGDTC